jgi:hypothetical protein
MNTNNNAFQWGEKQLDVISSKTLSPLATEVGEVLCIYNTDLSEQEKKVLKEYLINWEFQEEEFTDSLIKLKEIVDSWSDSIKEYCLIKLKTQDDLFAELTSED